MDGRRTPDTGRRTPDDGRRTPRHDNSSSACRPDELKTIEETLNRNSQAASEWSTCNDMVLNAKKCSSMLFATRQKMCHATDDVCMNVQIDDDPIPFVTKTKLLGVHLDNNLTWQDHIKHIHNKIVKNLYLLKQIKDYLSIKDRKLFYNSYILPHLDYCSVIWGNCSNYLLIDLLKLQKKAARLILNRDYTTPSSELFKELNWMPVQDRIAYNRSVQVFKCTYGPCPEQLQNLFTPTSTVHSHLTRSTINNNLHIGPNHIKSFSHLGAVTWNKLSPTLRESTNSLAFKNKYIKQYFKHFS